jgi:plasmid stabilization system protein ParE
MAEKKINLKWRSSSLTALEAIYYYIAESNPENAADFIERMLEFGNTYLTTKKNLM